MVGVVCVSADLPEGLRWPAGYSGILGGVPRVTCRRASAGYSGSAGIMGGCVSVDLPEDLR